MTLEARLNQLKCLQTWGFFDFNTSSFNRFVMSCEEVSPLADGTFNINSSSLLLKSYILMGFEKYRHEQFREALEYVENAFNIPYCPFMLKYKKCFLHLVKASKAFCLNKLEMKDSALEICDELEQESYSMIDEAGFCYLKSSLSNRYGSAGRKKCEGLMRKAIHLVKDEPTFHHHFGIILRKNRCKSFPCSQPSDEELYHLQKALSLDDECPWYAIDLATSFLDMRYGKRNKHLYNEKSACLLRRALEQSQILTGNTLAQCIFHLMKLISSNELYELEPYAALAKEKSNTIKVNHYIGIFYLKISQLDIALTCLQNASFELPFLIGLVLLLTYRLNDNVMENGTLDAMIEDYRQSFEHHQQDKNLFLLSICEFFLLVIGDMKKAAAYFEEFLTTSDLQFVFKLKCTKQFACVDLVKLMVRTLIQQRDRDPEITSLRDRLVHLLEGQNFVFSSLPPLTTIKRNVY